MMFQAKILFVLQVLVVSLVALDEFSSTESLPLVRAGIAQKGRAPRTEPGVGDPARRGNDRGSRDAAIEGLRLSEERNGGRRLQDDEFNCLCPGSCTILRSDYGVLTDGSGDACMAYELTGRYPNGWSCWWTIAPGGGGGPVNVSITFPWFVLDTGADSVSLFECETEGCQSEREIATFSSEPPDPNEVFTSTTGIVRVKFKSSAYWASEGMRLRWGVSVGAGVCGDGALDMLFEDCDDGNLEGGDGCSPECSVEPGWECPAGGPCSWPCFFNTSEQGGSFSVGGGNGSDGRGEDYADDMRCRWILAPSGASAVTVSFNRFSTQPLLDLVTLSCCRNASCAEPAGTPLPSGPDPGYRVLSGTGLSTPREVFRCPTGVARVEFSSDSCGGEGGFSFSFVSGNYSGPGGGYCGDGVVQALEECDGGGGCEGCSAVEGYTCAGGACFSKCGDGVQASDEECDDGNSASGDGCSACKCEQSPCVISVGPGEHLASMLSKASHGTTFKLQAGVYSSTSRHRHLVSRADNVSVVGAGNYTNGTVFSTGLLSTLQLTGRTLAWHGIRMTSAWRIRADNGSSLRLSGLAIDSVHVRANGSEVALEHSSVERVLDVTHGLGLEGYGANFRVENCRIRDPQDGFRVLLNGAGSTFDFVNASISAVDTAGHCIVSFANDSVVAIHRSQVFSCWANYMAGGFIPDGGGLHVHGNRMQVVLDDVVVGPVCGADRFAAAAFVSSDDGTLDMNRVVVVGNIGLGESIVAVEGRLMRTTLRNSSIEANSASAGRGAVMMLTDGGHLEVQQSQFLDNVASSDGGGLWSGDVAGEVTISNSYFLRNMATGSGGGAYLTGLKVDVYNTTFEGNVATVGAGGIQVMGKGLLNLNKCNFVNNQGGLGGGGAIFGRNASLSEVRFQGCEASSDGGGLLFEGFGSSSSEAYLSRVIFRNNTASSLGGGAFGGRTRMDMRNCTFEGNQGMQGGAMAIQNNRTLHFFSRTFAAPVKGIAFQTSKDGTRVYQRGQGALGDKNLLVTDLVTGENSLLATISGGDRPPLVFCVSESESVIIVFFQMLNRLEAWNLTTPTDTNMPVLATVSTKYWTQQDDQELLVPNIAMGNGNREPWNGWGVSQVTSHNVLYVSTFWETHAFNLTTLKFETFETCGDGVVAMELSHDGKTLYIARYDGSSASIWFFNTEAKECTRPFERPTTFDAIRFMTLSKDGKTLFVAEPHISLGLANEDNRVTAVLLTSGTAAPLYEYADDQGSVRPIVFPMSGPISVRGSELFAVHYVRRGDPLLNEISGVLGDEVSFYYGPFQWVVSKISFGSISISSSTMEDNTATLSGGGLFLQDLAVLGRPVRISNLHATRNSAGGNGGAIAIAGSATPVELELSTLSNNRATGAGGAISVFFTSNVTVRTSLIAGNEARERAPAILFMSATSDTMLTQRCAVDGGTSTAQDLEGSYFELDRVSVRDNFCSSSLLTALVPGEPCTGAITLTGTSVGKISYSSLAQNRATVGGALAVEGSSTAEIRDTNMTSNQVTGCGGAVLLGSSRAVYMSRVTIIDNHSDRDGGGVCLDAPGSAGFSAMCHEAPAAALLKAGVGLVLASNSARRGGGGLFVGCSQSVIVFRGLQEAVQDVPVVQYEGLSFANNLAGYGVNVASQTEKFTMINKIDEYMPGEKIRSMLQLVDGFQQPILWRGASLPYVVTVLLCRGRCTQEGEVLSRTYHGFGEDGVCDVSTNPVLISWPARANGSNSRGFDPELWLEHQIVDQIGDLSLQSVKQRITRKPCLPGHSYDEFSKQCLVCPGSTYILRPDVDPCHQCAVGARCDGSTMIAKVLGEGSSFADCTREDGCEWEEQMSSEGLILRLTSCPKGYVLVRQQGSTSGDNVWMATQDQCVECPPGRYSDVAARWDGGYGALVSMTSSNAAELCTPCKEWQKCSGGSSVEPLDVVVTASTSIAERRKEDVPTQCLQKMSVCGALRQRETLELNAIDNMHYKLGGRRINITVNLYERDLALQTFEAWLGAGAGEYLITLSPQYVGSHLMEVFVDGVQLTNSPFLLSVSSAMCPEGSLRNPNDVGYCICGNGVMEVGGGCVYYSTLLMSVIFPLVFFCAIFSCLYSRHKVALADHLWVIKKDELTISTGIIGKGTFGDVREGEFRGTKVAIKRVVPQKKNARKKATLQGSFGRSTASFGTTSSRGSMSSWAASSTWAASFLNRSQASAAHWPENTGAGEVSPPNGWSMFGGASKPPSALQIIMDSTSTLPSTLPIKESPSASKPPLAMDEPTLTVEIPEDDVPGISIDPTSLTLDSMNIETDTICSTDPASSSRRKREGGMATDVVARRPKAPNKVRSFRRMAAGDRDGAFARSRQTYARNPSVEGPALTSSPAGSKGSPNIANAPKSASGSWGSGVRSSSYDSLVLSFYSISDRMNRWFFYTFGPLLKYFGYPDTWEGHVRVQSFVTEMRLLSKLKHPCITTVMGAAMYYRNDPLMVMEFMECGSLYDILQNETFGLEADVLAPIIRDVTQGMRFLHAASPPIIHGDLKSANILVGKSMNAKVADFGLANKRRLGEVAGTPFFLAPELIRGRRMMNKESDVYAFGIMLFEIFSRQHPYEGYTVEQVLERVVDVDREEEFRPGFPPHCTPPIKRIMAECWTKHANLRPTFEELDRRLKMLDTSDFWSGSKARSETSETGTGAGSVGNQVLFDVFPPHVAERLMQGKDVEPESKECVTLFFSDIVGYTVISSSLDPARVSMMLNRLYTKFDQLTQEYEVFKVETIGDAYVAVTNLVKDQEDHAARMARFAQKAVEAAASTMIDEDDPSKGCLRIRVGLNSGPIVANVVGTRNKRYCLFGDAMNVCARMEGTSEDNRIHSSEAAARLISQQSNRNIPITSRGKRDIKGKGIMKTFWIFEHARKAKGEKPSCLGVSEGEPQNAIGAAKRGTMGVLQESSSEHVASMESAVSDSEDVEIRNRPPLAKSGMLGWASGKNLAKTGNMFASMLKGKEVSLGPRKEAPKQQRRMSVDSMPTSNPSGPPSRRMTLMDFGATS